MTGLWRCPELRVWAALVGLIGANLGFSYLHLGWMNGAIAFSIAAIGAALVLLVLMNLRTGSALIRLVAMIGFAWVAVMFTLAWSDYFTR